jgi:hypothetical protein
LAGACQGFPHKVASFLGVFLLAGTPGFRWNNHDPAKKLNHHGEFREESRDIRNAGSGAAGLSALFQETMFATLERLYSSLPVYLADLKISDRSNHTWLL